MRCLNENLSKNLFKINQINNFFNKCATMYKFEQHFLTLNIEKLLKNKQTQKYLHLSCVKVIKVMKGHLTNVKKSTKK